MASDFQQLFLQGLKQSAVRPNIFGYVPHEVQIEFHKSLKTGRLLLGGNRSGKTVGGAAETVWRLRGEHPYQRVKPVPIYARGTTVDIVQGLNKIMLPEIARWTPPSLLTNGSWEDSYSKQERVLSCSNGSRMDFLTNEMETDKHAGTSRDFQWFDEEPPQHIYGEDLLRLVDVNGKWILTMTPVEGMTWVYHTIYAPIMEEGEEDPDIDCFVVSTSQNPHVSEKVLDSLTKGMTEEEKLARRHGKFIAQTGLIYPEFKEGIHTLPPIKPDDLKHMTVIAAMDHGFRNPTAWLWATVDHEGRVIVFWEYYQSERTIMEHSQHLLEWEKANGLEPYYRIGDPAIAQRSAINGASVQTEYAENNVFIGTGNNDVNYGLNRVRQYIQNSGLFITSNCTHLIKELRNYRWDSWATKRIEATKQAKDQPKKVNDHACDALRYLIASRPEAEFAGAAGKVYFPMAVSPSTPPDGEDVYDKDFDPVDDNKFHPVLGSEW